MCVPNANDAGISSGQEYSTGLFPIQDQSTPVSCLDKFIQNPARADHLQGALFQIGIIISIQSSHAISLCRNIRDKHLKASRIN